MDSKPVILHNDPWRERNSRDQMPPDIDEVIKKLFKKWQSPQQPINVPWSFLLLLLVGLLVAWFALGFYVVSEGETGVVLRFGAFNREETRGLHWHAPLIESKYIVNTENVSRYEYEAEMLTTDENYANVKVAVMYRIADPESFMFNVEDPVDTLTEATASSLRQVVGLNQLDRVLADGREKVRVEIEQTLKETMKNYQTGIEIRTVKLLESRAPEQVAAAFQDVVKAREDAQRFIALAEAYTNKVIPKAKGEASRLVNESKAYQSARILEAKADVAEFNALLHAYKQNPKILQDRLYIEAMEKIQKKVPKIIINQGSSLSVLSLEQLRNMQGNRK